MNHWNVAKRQSDDLVEQLLLNRGLEDPQEREKFLNPDWDRDTHDPMLFKQMEDAVARVFLSLENGKKIVIHGDYDADGVSGSSLLHGALKLICEKFGYECNVDVFLPDREKDGYGVAMHTIERLAKEGVDLLITVDCGIANAPQLDKAHELGMDVIICDHHQLAPEIPAHAIILHPLAPGEDYPNKVLCGTGVAFKLASALTIEAKKRGADLPHGYEKWFLDLVAVATVTDVMPLKGENRALELYGLKVLNKTKRLGLKKIIEFSRAELGKIDTQAIGFQIGPRLNAAGRMKSAEIAFKALSSETETEADKWAAELEMLNRDRQRVSRAAYTEARKLAREQEDHAIHVVWSETWMPGIVGLVAGKLVTEFGKPAFALTRVGDSYVGSGRTAGGLHLVEAMRSCGDIFVKAGGHPQACGLTISTLDLVQEFQVKVGEFASAFYGEEGPTPTIEVEAEVGLDEINWEFYGQLEKFEPFGEGNRSPLFVSRNLQVVAAETMGKDGKHLRLTVNPKGGRIQKMVGFGFGEWATKLQMGSVVDVVYEVSINEWNGNRELQCRIVDLKTSL